MNKEKTPENDKAYSLTLKNGTVIELTKQDVIDNNILKLEKALPDLKLTNKIFDNNLLKKISEQFPEQLIFFNENEELLLYAKNLEIEKEKHLKRQQNNTSQQHKNINFQEHQRKAAREAVNTIMIKRGWSH